MGKFHSHEASADEEQLELRCVRAIYVIAPRIGRKAPVHVEQRKSQCADLVSALKETRQASIGAGWIAPPHRGEKSLE